MTTGIDPADVGQAVLDGVRENRFWLLTHPEMKDGWAARSAEILEAFGEADPERLEAQARLQQTLSGEG